MTVPESPADQRPPTARRLLPRWVGVVFPIVLGVGVIFTGVYAADRSSLPLAVALAATAGLGLAAGLAVRWGMPNRPNVLRAVVALAASLIGLLTVGLLTGGAIGILPRPEAGGRTQWAELAELVAAAGLAWLVLSARKPFGPDLDAEGRRARRAVDAPMEVAHPAAAAGVSARPRLSRPGPPSSPGVRPSAQGEAGGLWGRLRRRLGWGRASQPRVPPSTTRRRRPAADIRLKGATEHRCPYCLEEVTRGDARGVVVCPVCHTPHHADCWAVTGTCQVPHAYRS